MPLSYKICALNDLKKLTDLCRRTFIDAFEKDNNPEDFRSYINSAFSESSIRSQLENPDSLFYFIYNGSNRIGYFKINLKLAQTEKMPFDSIELERCYVQKEYQNKGFGTFILDHIKNLARTFNGSFIWLGVWEHNAGAIRFYERNGFIKFGSHPYYVGKDQQTDWLLKLDLA